VTGVNIYDASGKLLYTKTEMKIKWKLILYSSNLVFIWLK
jgi:hypothetical protein